MKRRHFPRCTIRWGVRILMAFLKLFSGQLVNISNIKGYDCLGWSCAILGITTLLKEYELPKSNEVNICKQKLERIHAEFNSNTSLWVQHTTMSKTWSLQHNTNSFIQPGQSLCLLYPRYQSSFVHQVEKLKKKKKKQFSEIQGRRNKSVSCCF